MTEISPEDILDYRNASGHGWRFYRVDGILNVYQEKKTVEEYRAEARKIQDFELRDDDVFIAAYPKCGTHWTWEVVSMILSGSAKYSKMTKESTMLGLSMFGKAGEMPSPRVMNCHKYFRHLPQQLFERKIKIIHVMRNPKDVSVSMYNHYNGLKNSVLGFEGPFSEFVELFIDGKIPLGSCFDYIKDFKKVEKEHPELPIINIFYEDLKKNLVEEIKKLSEFLCKPVSRELCEQIADACGFDKLKEAQKDKQKMGDPGKYFKDTFGMYRKGQVGDWKNWLTVAQNEAFDEVIEREMKGTGIEFTF